MQTIQTLNGRRLHLWIRLVFSFVLPLIATTVVQAQTLSDTGVTAPTPGPNDIFQLATNGNTTFPDGLNYYSNNSNPAGQTFTTGPNSTNLVSLAIRTAGLNSGGNYGTPSNIANYYLRIYSVSGSTATLIQSYTNLNPGFTDPAWLKWSGLSVPLAANSTYAFSVSDLPGGSSGYVALAVSTDGFSGGQIALIPIGGGTMTFGSGLNYQAVFDLGMFANAPSANTPVITVNGTPETAVYPNQPLTVTESALGSGTLYYQWQTDGGSGGSLTNIPGAIATNLVVAPASGGTFNYDVMVTNSFGSATSSVATVTVLPPVNVAVNVSQPRSVMPAAGLGVCSAVYDNDLISSAVAPELKAAGISAVRTPGGSYGDVYDWENNTGIDGAYVNSSDSFDNLMDTVVNPAGAQTIVTVNYGSNPANTAGGDTNVAAAWVAHANVTEHWGVKYWEIGNEIYGNGYYAGQDWEYDLHYPETNAATRVGQAALSPAAYGTNAIQFITAMKAQDPTIQCGVFFEGIQSGSNPWNNSLMRAVGTNADFVIIHWYPGSDTASTLAASTGIVATVTSTFTQLTNLVGATQASRMKLAITETGAGNATGAPVALFAADNYLTWLENGIVNVDYQILHTDLLQNNQTPGHAYYGAMMAHLLANIGDTFLTATSALSGLRVHATQRQDGQTGVMLVNMNPILTIPATVNISGPTLAGSGTCYQFGLTNFIGANDFPSYPVSSNTVAGLGNSFTIPVPPYTIIDLLIPSAPVITPPSLAAIGDQTVNVGQNLDIAVTATDTNRPQPILSFNLLSGPTNASLAQIDNSDATFNWRPLVTQAGTTNSISLSVADNSLPPLSATQTFNVIVNPLTPPLLSALTISNGQFAFEVNGQTGPDYAVQSSTNLINWNTVFITNSPAMPFRWMDTNNASLFSCFYRIQTGPPLP